MYCFLHYRDGAGDTGARVSFLFFSSIFIVYQDCLAVSIQLIVLSHISLIVEVEGLSDEVACLVASSRSDILRMFMISANLSTDVMMWNKLVASSTYVSTLDISP